MYYKNGREAAEGDKVLNLDTGECGMLHGLNSGSETRNARLAKFSQTDAYVTVSDCVHLDDIAAAEIPNSSNGGE